MKRPAMDCASLSQLHPFVCNDIFEKIMSYIPEKNKFGYGRVENYELSLKMCTISRQFRWWWCCSPSGPYKFSIEDVKQLVGKETLTLRVFLGRLNLQFTNVVKLSFINVEKIRNNHKDSATLKISPNVRNYENQTPLDLLIPKLLAGRRNYQFLLDGVFEEASAITISEALHYVFSNGSYEQNHLELADILIEKIKRKTGSEQLAIQAFTAPSWADSIFS